MNSDWEQIGQITAKLEKSPESLIVTLCTKSVGNCLFLSAKHVEGENEYYLAITVDKDGTKYFVHNGNKYIIDVPYYINQEL